MIIYIIRYKVLWNLDELKFKLTNKYLNLIAIKFIRIHVIENENNKLI